MQLKWHALTGQGASWRIRQNGLKGRCSTTELRPYMRLNILHGNNFADLGAIGMLGGVSRRMPGGMPAVATTDAC